MLQLSRIIRILTRLYKIRFRKENPFYLLIGVLLSQRTKDEVSWPASKKLFSIANNLGGMLKLSERQIEKIIYPVGFYRQKAKRIKQICRLIKEKYNGKVPTTREELMKLPGVGLKSASIILAYSFGIPTVPVDVHVNRISQRLAIVPYGYKPEKTQEVLESEIPKNLQITVNHLLVTFGKDICRPVRPQCYRCPIYNFCKYEKKTYYKSSR